MPSPFPGMNPYLEQRHLFQSFHTASIVAIQELLAHKLPPQFDALIEEHLYIHELPAEQRRLVGRADAAVVGRRSTSGPATAEAVRAAPAYGVVPMAVEEVRIRYIEIRASSSQELVTVIELLSPSNKFAGSDRDQYLQKRHRLLKSDANLVEIDLLRGGPRLPVEVMPPCDYCALVARAEERPRVGIWPIMLRERLPVVPIPLRPPHPDVMLDLQEMLDLVYDRGGYERRAYRDPPHPPLSPEDAAWAEQFLPARSAEV